LNGGNFPFESLIFSDCLPSQFSALSVPECCANNKDENQDLQSGLELVYVVDISKASIKNQSDVDYVENFINSVNYYVETLPYTEYYLSLHYLASSSEQNCLNGPISATGLASTSELNSTIYNTLQPQMIADFEAGKDFCENSDIENQFNTIATDVATRVDAGRDQAIVLIVGTEVGINTQMIQAPVSQGIDVHGILIGSAWSFGNIEAPSRRRKRAATANAFTSTHSAATYSSINNVQTSVKAAVTKCAPVGINCDVTAFGHNVNYGNTEANCCNAIKALYASPGSIDSNICMDDKVKNQKCWDVAKTDFTTLTTMGLNDAFVTAATKSQIDAQCAAATTTAAPVTTTAATTTVRFIFLQKPQKHHFFSKKINFFSFFSVII
jgi:hypothetical protein